MRRNLKLRNLVDLTAFVGSLGLSFASDFVPSVEEVRGGDINQKHLFARLETVVATGNAGSNTLDILSGYQQALDECLQLGSPAGQSSEIPATERAAVSGTEQSSQNSVFVDVFQTQINNDGIIEKRLENECHEEQVNIRNYLHNYHNLFYFLYNGEMSQCTVPRNSFLGDLILIKYQSSLEFYEYSKGKYAFSLSKQKVLRAQNRKKYKFNELRLVKLNQQDIGKLLLSQISMHGDKSISLIQAQVIFSGTCLFGDTIYGIDEEGRAHDVLTTKNLKKIINQIVFTMEESHPYEILFKRIFSSSVSLLHIVSKEAIPQLYFSVPEHNYVYKLLQLYVRGQLSRQEMIKFMFKVHERAENVRKFLIELCKIHNINLVFISSLSPIFKGIEVGDIDALLSRLNYVAFNKESEEEREEDFLNKTLSFLCSNGSVVGELWRYLKYNKLDEFDINDIHKIAYAVDTAEVIKRSESKKILLYDQIEELTCYVIFYRLFKDYLFNDEDYTVSFWGYLNPIIPYEVKNLYFLKSDLAKPLAKLIEQVDLFST